MLLSLTETKGYRYAETKTIKTVLLIEIKLKLNKIEYNRIIVKKN